MKDKILSDLDCILVEDKNNEPHRGYVGASSIGDSCERKLWYRYQGLRDTWDADGIRRVNDGHRTEATLIEHLKRIPYIKLIDRGEDGKQLGFKDFDGKYAGNLDGEIYGVPELAGDGAVFECKAVEEKKFNALVKLKGLDESTALRNWNMTYYAQAVTYMAYRKLKKHYMIVTTPGMRDYVSIITDANTDMAVALRDKAKRIIDAQEPPYRIGTKDWYECKWCSFREVCHE